MLDALGLERAAICGISFGGLVALSFAARLGVGAGGAIVGGIIIGVSEKLAEIYIPPVLQDTFGGNFGGIEGWFPYIFALIFLLVRPEGLFGEKHIDRV